MSAKPLGSKIIDSHTSYRQFLQANSHIYNERMKRILQKDFTQIKKSGIFENRDTPTSNLYFFWANKYNSNLREQIQDFIVQEIDHFYNNFQDTYALVYVHSSIFDFLAFRRMLEKWPEHFFFRLRRVYIMGPSIMVRLVETFSYGTFYRLCDQIFLNIESEEQLKQQDLALLKSNSEAPIPVQTKAYKESIKIISNQLYGKTLDEYDLYFGRYPTILLDLLRRLLKDPSELRVQGIFRRSCDHDQLERLQKQIISKQMNAIDKQQDIFVVAGCLKKILNNLSLPLFNYAIYNKVRDFTGGDEMALIKNILSEMEYVNHKTFVLLLVFLSDYVVSQQEYNKMSSYNLAVIFGPCFFRPKEYDLKDLIYSGKFAKVLVTLFDRQEELIDISERKLAKSTLQQLIKQQHQMK